MPRLIWKDKASGEWGYHVEDADYYFRDDAKYALELFESHGDTVIVLPDKSALVSSDCLQVARKKYKRVKTFPQAIKHATGTLREFLGQIIQGG